MRLRNFEQAALDLSDEGYFVCDSGGKDSSVIKQLCIEAGVKFAVYHHHTTVDHPETVYFVRREQQRFRDMGYKYEIDHAYDKNGKRITMWSLIANKGFPTRIRRFCCESLKEGGKMVVSRFSAFDGLKAPDVRSAASTKRSPRTQKT